MGSQVGDFLVQEVGLEVGRQERLGCKFILIEVTFPSRIKNPNDLNEYGKPKPDWERFSQKGGTPKVNNQHGTSSGLGAGAVGILAGHKKNSSELCGGGSGHHCCSACVGCCA